MALDIYHYRNSNRLVLLNHWKPQYNKLQQKWAGELLSFPRHKIEELQLYQGCS